MTQESLFCLKYLYQSGYFPKEEAPRIQALISRLKNDYQLVKVEDDGFFKELAEKLRELWPPGEKDGKFAWRDSVPNLIKRLKVAWSLFGLENYNVEDCLSAARRYLAQYEMNAKYMKTLKYFILKQTAVKDADGNTKYIQESSLAVMLQDQPKEEVSIFAGELI